MVDEKVARVHEPKQEGMLDAGDAIERLCALQTEVNEFFGHHEPADCFCAKGGYWSAAPADYGPTYQGGYRNSGHAISFIEAAVRAVIDARKAVEGRLA